MLFSDIEGSTALLSRLGGKYGDVLDIHRRVLRAAWVNHGGAEMGTEGDSFFVVFESAADGVRAALEAQRGMAVQDWPRGVSVAVRIGLHTGEPMRHGDGYVGMDVHRAARVSAAAHGGQVVMTEATHSLARETVVGDAIISDLGWHRFKDFADPLRVFQALPTELARAFPPLRSLGTSSSLPVAETDLVGRETDLETLQSLLDRPRVRLLTLTGPGGTGKTRLATAVAAARANTQRDGVFFVPLADVTEAEDVWGALIQTVLGSSDGGSRERLLSLIADREMLLVLDNLEQIADAPEVVHHIVSASTGVVVVATSRRRLHVRGEREYPVPPLPLPASDAVADTCASPAVQLFCQHAQLVRPDFTLTSDNAVDVAGICTRLDGLPLSIELAASRMRLMSPATLLKQLGSTLDISDPLLGRPRRHSALRATIAWSYDLLDDMGQEVFRRLGAFVGGADLNAVQEVVLHDRTADAYDVVAQLAEASLITVSEGATGQLRVSMLRVIHEFARDRLIESSELDAIKLLHAQYLIRAADGLDERLTGPGQQAVLLWLNAEAANINDSLDWSLRPGKDPPPEQVAQLGIGLCVALRWALNQGVVGLMHEMARWYERALELDAGNDSAARAILLRSLTLIEDRPPRDRLTLERLEEAVAISRRLGDPRLIAEMLGFLSTQQLLAGDVDAATRSVLEAMALAREAGDDKLLAGTHHWLGLIEAAHGDHEAAISAFLNERGLWASRGDEAAVVSASLLIAESQAELGRPDSALRDLSALQPDIRRVANPALASNALASCAHVLALLGQRERAVRAVGSNWAQATKLGYTIEPESEEVWLQLSGIAAIRDSMPAPLWDALIQAGERASIENAFADAFASVSD